MDVNLVIYILMCLLFMLFFAGMETAYLTANKLQIELQGKHGSFAGKFFSHFTKRPSLFIGTTFIGNMISLILYGLFLIQLADPLLRKVLPEKIAVEAFIIPLEIIISAALVLLTVDLLPRNLFSMNPNQVLTSLVLPFLVLYILLFPLVYFVISCSKLIVEGIFKQEFIEDKPFFGFTDFSSYIKNATKSRQEEENIDLDRKIFNNALEFKSVRVRECMIPRTEIVAVALSEGIAKLKDVFVESGHSKIVVYKESVDDVIGYCHSAALFKKPDNIEEILTPIIIVPETTLANELMTRFIDDRKSLAIVIDEFGGTAGLVTMEDVIEKIFGDIEDEHDQDDLIEQRIDEHTYRLSARLEIDYLNETYNWQLPVGEYETLAGLILLHTEEIPEPGEKIAIPPFLFIIESTFDNRINVLKMVLKKDSILE